MLIHNLVATGSAIVSGSSTITGDLTVLGSISGTISGSVDNAISASYAINATNAITAQTASYADSFTVAGTLTAQKLVVQTITSSVIYSSGSNIFGNSLANTQVMTGSVTITGSLSVNGTSSVVGSGTTNQLSKFTGANTIGNSNLINDANGNLGLGVTPSAWLSSVKAFQFAGAGSIFSIGNTNNTFLSSNEYINASGDNIYINSTFATRYQQFEGSHRWYTAPSGTAGNAISFTQAMTLTASGRLFIGATNGIGNDKALIVTDSSGTFTQVLNLKDSNSSANGTNFIVIRKNDDTYLGTIARNSTDNAMLVNGNAYLALGSGLTERMRITSGGNILINTTTDSGYKLNVNGNAYTDKLFTGTQGVNLSGYGALSQTISGQMTILGHNLAASNSVANQVDVMNSGWYSSMMKIYYSDGITFHTSTTVYSAGSVYPYNTNERMRIDLNGNVGIGVNNPFDKLDVNGAIRFRANTPNFTAAIDNGIFDYVPTSIFTDNPCVRLAAIGTASVGAEIRFLTGTSTSINERMRIFGNGDVRINFNPGAANGLYFNDVTSGAAMFYFIPANYVGSAPYNSNRILAANNSNIAFEAGGSERMRITSDGNVLIGTTTDAGFKLDVNGTGRFSGDVRFKNEGYLFQNQSTVSNNGTVTVTTANTGGGGFQGFMIVTNTVSVNASQRTFSTYSYFGRGTSVTFTLIATNDGASGGASFTLSCPSNGVIQATNTSGSTCFLTIQLFGGSSL
jgi:hypothetical protein